MKILILGATGLVGRNALAQAFAQPTVTHVIAPTRKPLTTQAKLMNQVASKLEQLRLVPRDCRILSVGAAPPRPETGGWCRTLTFTPVTHSVVSTCM
jgi:hypothetical protein